jgi:hypothetical protein
MRRLGARTQKILVCDFRTPPLQTLEVIEGEEPILKSRNDRVVITGVVRVGYEPILVARKTVIAVDGDSGFSITVCC